MNQEREQGRSKRESFSDRIQGWFGRVEVPWSIPPTLPKELFPFGKEKEELERVRFTLNQEQHENTQENTKHSRKSVVLKADDFEPFNNREPQEENLFVNNYGGAYSQKMELNRKGVERALKIAHLEGKVYLSTLAPSRSRAEAQGNELAAKRFVIFDRKTQRIEEENPYKRVVSVPEGWRIEINDQRLLDELREKRVAGQELQEAFVRRFNRLLKEGIRECVWKEKCSSEKDPYFRHKFMWSAMFGAVPLTSVIPYLTTDPYLTPVAIGGYLC